MHLTDVNLAEQGKLLEFVQEACGSRFEVCLQLTQQQQAGLAAEMVIVPLNGAPTGSV